MVGGSIKGEISLQQASVWFSPLILKEAKKKIFKMKTIFVACIALGVYLVTSAEYTENDVCTWRYKGDGGVLDANKKYINGKIP